MSKRVFVIDDRDNVATVVRDEISAGTVVSVGDGKEVEIKDDISYGHKFALHPIEKGEEIIKYGLPIGRASRNISQGEHVHVHNIEAIRARGDLAN